VKRGKFIPKPLNVIEEIKITNHTNKKRLPQRHTRMDDDDDDDDKHDKRRRQEKRAEQRRLALILLTAVLFAFVWFLEHSERDAFYVSLLPPPPGGGGGGGGGWKRYTVPAHDADNNCAIDRYRIDELSLEKFNREYREKRPVVVSFREQNEDQDWKYFREKLSSKGNLLRMHGDKTITLSSANTFSYDKKDVKLKDYLDENGIYLKPIRPHQRADKIWYWFGDNDHDGFGVFFPAFKRASLIGKKYVPESASVAYSFGVGGPLSGVPYHIHGPGWSESIYGRKKWFVSPPMFEPVFNGNETAAKAAMRFKANGNKARFKKTTINDIGRNNKKMKNKRGVDVDKYGNEKKVLTCVVDENEGIYFPDRWWHSTLNLDESVFISSFVNF